MKTENDFSEMKARKNILKKGAELRAGDYVTVGDGVIEELLPRRNSLIRPPVSNIDKLIIVIARQNPDPCFYNIDKMTVIAEYHGIEPVIVLNKSDFDDVSDVLGVYGRLPYRLYSVCASERIGTDALAEEIRGCTCVLSGVSGAGKSTLLNAVAPELLRATGDVSERLRRGRHTTRCAELFDICGGVIADTPGFSSVEIEAFDLKDRSKLAGCFPEFEPYFSECRFRDCAHVRDSGCAVREAVDKGEIPESRHESYVQMYEGLGEYKKWENC